MANDESRMANATFSERLEALRNQLGLNTLQDFVNALNARAKPPVPYATARHYHRDREPPASYLKAVAGAFGVRIRWLLTGDGPMFEVSPADNEKAARRLLGDVLRGLAPYPTPDDDGYLSMADPDAADAFSARLNLPGIPVWLAPLSEVCRRTGRDGETVGRMLAGPLEAAGVRLLSLKGDALTDYVTSMIPALFALADYVPTTEEESVDEDARQHRDKDKQWTAVTIEETGRRKPGKYVKIPIRRSDDADTEESTNG